VNCLCISLWRLFKQQLSQKEKENNKIISKDTTSSEEVTLKLLDILKYSPVKDEQISKIQSILQDIQKKNNDSTAQYKEITKNKKYFPPETRLELEAEVLSTIIEEAQ